MEDRPTGSLLVEIQPFAVKTEKDLLLLDTGLGFSAGGVLQIHQNLRSIGFFPEQVTKVLLSHLHKDHAGGIAIGEGAQRKLSFPNAEYFVAEQELAYALEKGMPSYPAEELRILVDHPQVRLISDNTIIDGYIEVERSGGHCPFHQVFRIREGNELIFYGGDEAPQLKQMKHRFAAKYDYDGKRAQQLRQQWWEQGAQEAWTFLFFHDISHPHWKFAV
jgi:glyoxylase-like metal-dependent hydrolase (beta-lactamase superfamily II)